MCRSGTGWTQQGGAASLSRLQKQKEQHGRGSSSRPAAGSQVVSPLSRRRRWWFRLAAALLFPVLLLLAAEGILRMAGFGYPTGFFKRRATDGANVWIDNQDFGRRFFPPGLERSPRPFTLPVAKSPDATRIFVLGESAAMGDPDFKFGLPRMLEVLLRERFPGKRFEVVNAAMVAINSHVILPIARDCAEKQGDLWVIYMGNNEMIGPYGAASVFGARAPALPLVRAGLQLKRWRIGQALDAAQHLLRQGREPLPEWGGMEMISSQRVAHDSPASARVRENFARNLDDILRAGTRAGMPVILCTAAGNLEDCPPFASLHRADLAPSAKTNWEAFYAQGAALQEAGNFAGAEAQFAQANSLDDQFADLAFRRAQCARDLARPVQAAALFARARDLDALQFRTDSLLNEAIRQAAANFAGTGVRLLDAESLLATNSPAGLIGSEFFHEHVHLTPEGNYLLARAIADLAAETLALKSATPWLSQAECFHLLGLTDWNRLDALDTLIDRLRKPPFTAQLAHDAQMERLREQSEHYRLATKPARVSRAARQVASLIAQHPADPDLRWNLAQLLANAGDLPAAAEQWRALKGLQPQSALPPFNLAQILERMEDWPGAAAAYREALRLDPRHYAALYADGMLALRTGDLPDAIRRLEAAVDQKPLAVDARLGLARALTQAGKNARAKKQLAEALRLDPGNPSAQAQLDALR